MDATRIERTLAEHGDFVRQLARSLLADEHAADDVAQEAWLAAYRAPPQGGGNVRAWLGSVVRNLAGMRLRSEKARRRRERDVALPEAVPDPTVLLDRLDEGELLVQALRCLREPFRSALILRYREGLPPRAIAARTKVPLETVKSRLKRGLQMLRADLTAAHDGDERAWRQALAPLAAWPRVVSRSVVAVGSLFLAAAVAFAWLFARPFERTGRVTHRLASSPRVLREAVGVGAERVRRAEDSTATTVAPRRTVRLVDAESRTSLVDFVLQIVGADEPFVVTDGDGKVELPTGDGVEVYLLDDPRMSRRERVVFGARDNVVLVPVGPTFELALSPVTDATELEARLSAADSRIAHGSSFAPVRAGVRAPWVRFGPEARALRGGPPWRLEIRGRDGYWIGHASVGPLRPSVAIPVSIEMAQCGRVRGVARDENGERVAQCRIQLLASSSFETATDGAGEFDLSWVPAGRYTLRIDSPLHERSERIVSVRAGLSSEADVILQRKPRVGIVAGRLASMRGVAARDVALPITVLLRSSTGAVLSRKLDRFGAFQLPRVPLGRYEVSVHALDFARWSVTPPVIDVPFAQLTLERRDLEPASDHVLRATGPEGKPIRDFSVFVRLDDELAGSRVLRARDGEAWLRNLPDDADVTWTLRASGFAPVQGARAGLGRRVSLRRGWGNTFRVLDEGRRPVAGVEMSIDGRVVGRTGSDGRLSVRADARPRTVAIGDERLRISGGDLLGSDGGFRDLIWGVTLVVSPR